ncbi:MAG: LLM class flavin-dependent oxidoreductase [Chloroflexota bacterium]|nr:LLM class flavin-dependent oxidoreductase [Chloroflexota bacterium]
MSNVEFGWFFPDTDGTPAGRANYVENCDRHLVAVTGHFTSAWMADHMQFDRNDVLEGWTQLTYFAARHADLRFGHAVLCQSYRNPALLAKMAATFQFLSGGRFIFGLGAGWHEPEYKAYNYPFPSAGARVEELEETLAICKALWTGEEATFTGKHYSVHGAICVPPALPTPLVMIGGRRPRMLRFIAKEADWWDVSGFGVPREDYSAIADEMERACTEVGRDPATLRRTFSCECACASTEAELAELTKDMRPGMGLVGTPQQIIEQVAQFAEAGVSHFQLAFRGFPETAPLELFIAEVLPGLKAENA